MSLKILQYPHRALKNSVPPTLVFDDLLRQQIAQMFEIMYAVNGWGLAAPQLGFSFRGFVMDISPDQKMPQCFLNPEIVSQEGSIDSEEDCLSLPGLYINVLRAKEITLHYQNEYGEAQQMVAKDLSACFIQHEIDLLNGVLMIDHLSKLKRDRLLKKYLKQRSEHSCGHHCHHDHA